MNRTIEIKNRWTGAIIVSGKAESLREFLKQQIKSRANLSGANLSGADLSRADLSRANLSGADLSWANLSRADLSWADLDYSCWPLWCGSKGVKVDIKIVHQLLAHVCAVECCDKEFVKIKKAILPYAVKSHRAGDLGVVMEKKARLRAAKVKP